MPEEQRRFGYYVLPFLLGDTLVGRVDLKSDRQAGVLRVQSAWIEPGHDPGHVAVELAPQKSVDVEWRVRSGADQPGDVDVDVTPSVEARQSSFTATSACSPAA